MAPRVALYCRVSTTDQTCENQLRDLREYCAARGGPLDVRSQAGDALRAPRPSSCAAQSPIGALSRRRTP